MKSKHVFLWFSLIGALLLALVWSFAQAGQIEAAGSPPAGDMLGFGAGTAVSPTAPLATPQPVASVSIHGTWTKHNNNIVWNYSGGDIGTYFSALRQQSVNGGGTQVLLDVDGQDRILGVQADNVAFYTWNDVDNSIEKRIRGFLEYPPNVLFTFGETTKPLDFVIDNTVGPDGRIYYYAADNRIYWVDKYGNNSSVLWLSPTPVRDLAVDDYYIWVATGGGVYRFEHNCPGGCLPAQQQNAAATFVYGASDGPASGDRAVFFITDTTPPRVESWDCNIPGQSSCANKTLYTAGVSSAVIYSLIATPTHVWWTEKIPGPPDVYQLRRAPRAGGAFEIMAVLDGQALYGGPLALDDQYIYFRHNGLSRLPLDSTPIVFNFEFMGSEITQGIQNMDGGVLLQQGMPAYLLLYVKQTSGPDVGQVEIEVSGSRYGTPLPGSPLRTIGVLTPGTADLTQPRQGVPRITVALPGEWMQVGLPLFSIKVDPRQIYDQTPATRNHQPTVEWQPPLCIKGIRVKVHGPDIVLNDGSLAYAVSQAKRMLPVRDIRLYFDWEPLEEGVWPFYSPYELPSDDWKVMANLWWRDRFSDDPDSCDNDEARTLYLGGYHMDFNPGFNGMAAVGLDQLQVRMPEQQPRWPVPYRNATLAHEIGHNLGRYHVDCGDPDDPDTSYPYPSCWIGVPNGIFTYYGYYAPSDRLISPIETADLMSYGYPRWPSDWTWNHLETAFEYPRLLEPWRAAALAELQASASRSPDSGAGVYLSGWVDTAALTGGLDPVVTIPVTAMSADMQRKWAQSLAPDVAMVRLEETAVTYHVRFVGPGGSIVADHAIELLDLDARLREPLKPFAITVPRPAGVYLGINLMADSTVLASRSGIGLPVVALSAPVGGASIVNDLTVAWNASDPFGSAPLTFLVQYSPDNGTSWHTLANGITGPAESSEYSVSYGALSMPGSAPNQARVRVIATDGFLTTVATSDPFTLAQRPPTAYITEPAAGNRFPAGQTITLAGGATDPEDDYLQGAALAWSIGGVSYGTGSTQSAAGLAPGAYTARLTASDSGLAYGVDRAAAPQAVSSSVAESSFVVAPVEAAAGTAVLDGACSDAGYGQSSTLPLKAYSDGTFAYAMLLRNERYLWICFNGLRKQGASSPGAFVGVRIDPDNSRDAYAQSDDYGFFIRQTDGTLMVKQGNGSGGFGDDAIAFVASAFDARLSDRGTTWSAELRLDLGYLRTVRGWQDVMGFDFGHYWVDAQGNDFHWPHRAQYNRPNTWAASLFRRVPGLLTINPTQATAGDAAFTLTVTGEDLQAGDTAYFGGTQLATTYVSPTQLTAQVPTSALAAAGEVAVTLRSSESQSVFSAPQQFTVYNRTPALTSLAATAAGGGADLLLTLNGSGFVNGAKVDFDGVALAATYVNSTRLTAVVPQSLLTIQRPVQVVAYNPSPTQGVSNALPYQIGTVTEMKVYLPFIRRN